MTSALALIAAVGSWMMYPGDYGIWKGNEIQASRVEWGQHHAPDWAVYGVYPQITFLTTIKELGKPAELRMIADGQVFVQCSAWKPSNSQPRLDNFVIPAGKDIALKVSVFNQARPPALRILDTGIAFGEWKCRWNRTAAPEPVEFVTGGEKTPPALTKLAVKAVEPEKTWRDEKGRLFADFGRETYGYVKLRGVKGAGKLKIVYAESQAEAEAEEFQDGTIKRALDGSEVIEVGPCGEFRVDVPHGFRYICVRPYESDVSVASIAMDFEWKDLPLRGAFECDDELLNRIWQVSAYTLSLTRRDVFIEGVKRDHWVWSGDAVQNLLMEYYTCGDYEGARNTLWCLRGKDPVAIHLNGIMDYSFYWFDAVMTYVRYSGDTRFFEQVYPRMKTFMDWCLARLDGNGRPAAKPGDWIFIDWTPGPMSRDRGVTSFEQILLVRALEATAAAARRSGDTACAEAYAGRAAKLKAEVKPIWWDAGTGALRHMLWNSGAVGREVTRYPNMFALKWGYFDEAETKSVLKNVIDNDRVMKIQTPYMRFYELETLCSLGKQAKVLDEMRSYWGDMLRLGATTFWEVYNPEEKGAQHYAMYGRDFGRSLCHAWGASPVYLLGRFYLGVEPTSDGFATYDIRPNLGGLRWMRGRVPTPKGDIEVEVRDGKARVKGPEGTVGTLYWNGETRVLGF